MFQVIKLVNIIRPIKRINLEIKLTEMFVHQHKSSRAALK